MTESEATVNDHKWNFVPKSRPLSVLYLLAGTLLIVSAAWQFADGVALLPAISAVSALALIAMAVLGLVKPGSEAKHG
ncbi:MULTISPECIES: hypothetical protein [unclassified Streptomyces]|uniref:hypothetical protein n=1 Tax=unclassified Streptomyces TaxID=2593676 RepID=UPI0024B7CF2E|nr:hypothetical protein [Streptomyces sp. KAU_LT]MDI9832578.1 hypothetical protein [Streptomyces sp. KAU_LT]